MRQLDSEGRIYTDSTVPQLKRYLDEMPGQAVADIWTDVPAINSQAKERTGYPTQKPLALLERIIAASSNPDDVVLDPFCGCATALIAAEKLTRKWVGIDISEMAVRLVRHRLYREVPLFTQDAIDRSDVPRRTDLVDEVREYQNDKHVLYGQQEGHCNGCGGTFEFRQPGSGSRGTARQGAEPTTSATTNSCADSATAPRALARRRNYSPS